MDSLSPPSSPVPSALPPPHHPFSPPSSDSEEEDEAWMYESAAGNTGAMVSQKEKSIYEMIDVLNVRLLTLNHTMERTQVACASDINPNSDKTLASLEATAARSAHEKKEHVPPPTMSDEASRIRDKFGIPDPARLTWKDKDLPQTDAGRRLENVFTVNLAAGKKARAGKGGQAGRLSSKKNVESRKEARTRMERRLNNNSEHYVIRAVNSVIYTLPPEVQADLRGQRERAELEQFTTTSTTTSTNHTQHNRLNSSTVLSQPSKLTFSVHNVNPFNEPWPIRLGGTEMQPKWLLTLAAEKLVLVAGESMMKRLCLHELSCHIFVYMYWFIHCRFFQAGTEVEQQYLLSKVAAIYTQLLSLKALEAHKDFFFKNYPFVLSQAIVLGFKYLCPGNQSLYTPTLKRILFLTVAQLLTGVDVCPGSVNFLRHEVYPEDAVDGPSNPNESNKLPPLPFVGGNKQEEEEEKARMEMGGGGMGNTKGGILGLDDNDEYNNSSILFGVDTMFGGEGGEIPKYTYKGTGALTDNDGKEDAGTKMNKSISMPNFDSAEFPPVNKFTGPRETLRFRPDKPSYMVNKYLPRQQQVKFDASSISPLLQQYLDHHSDTAGRKPQQLKRTEPVKWCNTGGVDTHLKVPSRHGVYDKMMREYEKNKKVSTKELHKNFKTMKEEVLHVEEERQHVLRGNSTSIGKKAIDIMKIIEGRGKGHKLHKEPVGSGIPKANRREIDAGETSVFRRLPIKGLNDDGAK